MNRDHAVDEYIARAPVELRSKLTALRRTIRAAVPSAIERVSYRMPGYGYPGPVARGMFAWFALQRQHIGLYLRPPTVADHRQVLAGYGTTLSAVHLPIEGRLPVTLVRTLVRASARRARESRPPGRSARTGRPASRARTGRST